MAHTSEPSWAELLGSNSWSNLRNPMDPTLASWLIRWGEMIQAAYDALDQRPDSRFIASCRYTKEQLLKKTNFPYDSDYKVVDFLYGSVTTYLHSIFPAPVFLIAPSISLSTGSNFQGYVAVSSDDYAKKTGRREICVVWRGTQTYTEWINNANFPQTSVRPLLMSSPPKLLSGVKKLLGWMKYNPFWYIPASLAKAVIDKASGEPKVAEAWYHIYTESNDKSPYSKFSARKQLLATLNQLLIQYKDEDLSIVCVGHSLGATLAVLSAFDIVQQGLSKKGENDHFPVTAVTFGSPMVGNSDFSELLYKQPKLKVVHVMNKGDLTTIWPLVGYVEIGEKIQLDPRKSERISANPSTKELHGLKNVLHVLLRTRDKSNRIMSIGNVNEYVKPERKVMKEEEEEEYCVPELPNIVLMLKEEEEEEYEPELPNIVLMLEAATANAADASAAAASVPAI